MRRLVALLLLLCVPAAALAARPVRIKKHRKPRQPSWFEYRAFPPTPDSLILQNEAIDELGLPRIKDSKALAVLVQDGELVPITNNKYVRVSPRLEANRRYCKPWVDDFLQELGRAYFDQFEEPIQVNSAVRTTRTQMTLLRWNHNASPVHGDKASAHLAGVAVDLQRRGLTRAQVRFIQQKLLYLAGLNMVIVEEELKQPCFHIVVTGDYPWLPPIKLETKPPDLLFLQEVPDGNRNFIQPNDCPQKPRVDGSGNPSTP
jgi:hypothetical protein